jgi:DNA-binding NarL/FixJ family response regulator
MRAVDTLAVCDPEPIAMEGLRHLMESIDGPRVVAAETSVEGAAAAVGKLQPTVLVVNKAFGASNVMDWVRLLSVEPKPTAVIVWGTQMAESEAVRFLQAGAAGVVRRTAPLADLTDCIRAVVAGKTWMQADLADRATVAVDTRVPVRTKRCALTPREAEVSELVERGYKNREIGQSLGIRTGTVKIHLKHIFEKTGIRGRYGLALSGLRHKGLLTAVL